MVYQQCNQSSGERSDAGRVSHGTLGGRELLAVQSVKTLLFYSIYTVSPQQQTLTGWEESAETDSDVEWRPRARRDRVETEL